MSEDTTLVLGAMLMFTLLVLGLCFAGQSCDGQRQKAILECVKAGQQAEACHRAMP